MGRIRLQMDAFLETFTMKAIKKDLNLIIALLIAVFVAFFNIIQDVSAQIDSCSQAGLQKVNIKIDGVELAICTPYLPGEFVLPEPGDLQIATSVKWHGYQEISIMAIPFGTRLATEDLPIAAPGMEDIFRNKLREYRSKQNGSPQVGPISSLFGRQTQGSVSVINTNISGSIKKPVVITEWVVEAGQRIWIIRTSQEYLKELTPNSELQTAFNLFSGLSISSKNIDQPSTLLHSLENQPTMGDQYNGVTVNAVGDLPSPNWWSGTCDTDNYSASAGRPAYPLGGSYRGVKSCGPRPYSDGAPDYLVRFFPGAYGEYEWECVELSMRYLYLAFGIAPYSGNGSNVVWNYSGNQLIKIANGTAGIAPEPGDVISYGATSTFGHTSIVSASNVDANGNGTITIIDQNNSSNGTQTHTVSNWNVLSTIDVTGWLHEPYSLNPPTLFSPSQGRTLTSRSVHFTWENPNATNQSGYTFRLSVNSNPDTQPWLMDTVLGNEYSSYDYSFNADGTYYWHMRTWNTSNQASSWVTRSFVINTSGGGGNNPPAGFTWCADEDGHCNFSGTADVVYGAVNSFTSPSSFTNGTDCNNGTFGDPISGTQKACYYKLTSPPPSSNLHVEYFNDKTLGSQCYDGYENSTYVFKNWGTGSPAIGCNSDNFSARFTGTYNFPGGSYSFHCQHDDGCRIYIDDQLMLDAWWDSSFTGNDWSGPLISGPHVVKIEFYDSGGAARLEAFWSGPGFLPTGPDCISGEWCGQYFGNKDLAGTAAVQRNEGNININYTWNGGGIGFGFPNDNFSVRWIRNVYFAAGHYRFHIKTSDGGRLWVNNDLVIDEWKDQGATEYTIDLDLGVGEIPLKFEYYENGGGAVAQMWWDALQVYSPPSAGFGTWPQSGAAPFTTALHIVDMSNITSCSWDYGDGQTSTTCTQLHDHVYNNPGLYTVSLTVNGPGGSDSMTRIDYITVNSEPYKIYLPLVMR